MNDILTDDEKNMDMIIVGEGKTLRKRVDEYSKLLPLELAQGDAIHRTNPSSRQVVNTNQAWLASQPSRPCHALARNLESYNSLATDLLALLDRAMQGLEEAYKEGYEDAARNYVECPKHIDKTDWDSSASRSLHTELKSKLGDKP